MSLNAAIRAALRRAGERIVLIDAARRWSGHALDSEAEALAQTLAARLPAEARVLLFMKNRAEYVVAQIALERAGLVRMPVNYRATAHELAALVERFSPALALTDRAGRERLPGGLPALALDDATAWRGLRHAPLPDVSGAALASINLTSGSSGEPKGAMLTHDAWAHVCRNMLIDRDIRADDIILHIGPLTHAAGTYVAPHLLRGATNVIVDYDGPPSLFAAIERHRATAFTCVPTVLTRLLDDPAIDRFDLASLRQVIYGAEPIPRNTLEAAWRRFGAKLTQNYGLTEAMMTVATLQGAAHLRDGALRHDAIGRPYSFVEVCLRDADGEPVPQGTAGELTIRSDHLMTGYWDDPAATAQVLRGGWLFTGDEAVEASDGVLTLTGRLKDLVISGGFNIAPREVEAAISGYAGVSEAAVFGLPDPQWGERLIAVVAGDESRIEDWRRQARAELGIKAPKQWLCRQGLPRTANGKIDKARLKQEVGDARD